VLPQDADEWLRRHVQPRAVAVEKEMPWATTWRIETAADVVFFKACGAVQAFEPRLTGLVFARNPLLVVDVLAHDDERHWLLTRDAGVPLAVYGNPPEPWLDVLPRYAELQVGEAAHADDHVAHGVPDLRLAALPERFEWMLGCPLPLDEAELAALRGCGARVAAACAELAAAGIAESVQHDDLHMGNVAERDGVWRIMDWGDASIAHPFFSLLATFVHLEEIGKLPATDPWFARLRDAYLEPWGSGLADVFALAYRVGQVAWAIAWTRQRAHLPPGDVLDKFDFWYRQSLLAALAAI
jgi:hypothetical protein